MLLEGNETKTIVFEGNFCQKTIEQKRARLCIFSHFFVIEGTRTFTIHKLFTNCFDGCSKKFGRDNVGEDKTNGGSLNLV